MARLLVKAGRLEHARAFLEQVRPSNVQERIARLFLLGRIERKTSSTFPSDKSPKTEG